MRRNHEAAALTEQFVSAGVDIGVLMRAAEDDVLDGRTIRLDGKPRLNFASCGYLGLELDPRLREAACAAVIRYGTQFSSSRAYLEAPAYPLVEQLLGEMFGGHALLAPSTTLGHHIALPVLIDEEDAVLVDAQVHHSVQSVLPPVRELGADVEMLPHNNMRLLERKIERAAPTHRKVWYLADGVYSMFGDPAPVPELAALLDRHEQLHLYMDDSHGIGWSGRHGHGPTSDMLAGHDRVIVIGSLNKSFAGAGAALVLPTAELKQRMRVLGGPSIFSGPIQPPMLGALLASARIHLSPELDERQTALRERIELCTNLMREFDLPLASDAPTPICHVTVGLPEAATEVVRRLFDDGIYTSLAVFPAVPVKKAGLRITLTLHNTPDDIRTLVHALARHLPHS
ncbi:MAG TPA: aminotransferase class I/II-fold pyridoxal phosphate-dependent enzyme [Pseudonocardiaceae bacterium]|jgi:7-keto-8-aminopelargonate synthetase-like enzyme